jgi:hypothetical protein
VKALFFRQFPRSESVQISVIAKRCHPERSEGSAFYAPTLGTIAKKTEVMGAVRPGTACSRAANKCLRRLFLLRVFCASFHVN